jgi:hypothetical protein
MSICKAVFLVLAIGTTTGCGRPASSLIGSNIQQTYESVIVRNDGAQPVTVEVTFDQHAPKKIQLLPQSSLCLYAPLSHDKKAMSFVAVSPDGVTAKSNKSFNLYYIVTEPSHADIVVGADPGLHGVDASNCTNTQVPEWGNVHLTMARQT